MGFNEPPGIALALNTLYNYVNFNVYSSETYCCNVFIICRDDIRTVYKKTVMELLNREARFVNYYGEFECNLEIKALKCKTPFNYPHPYTTTISD